MTKTSSRYSPEVRAGAARKFGCTVETLRKWVRQAERFNGSQLKC